MSRAEIQRRVAAMARMQIGHNEKVHPQWREQEHEYFRAIWVECAELLDHYGWKWWKHQPPDLDQVRLEIVDIWHFGLSDLIRAGRMSGDHCDAEVVDAIEAGLNGAPIDFLSSVETLATSSLEQRQFAIDDFLSVLVSLPMSFDELFDGYIGKNVLNNFRQNYGYQTGDYVKVWAGREDNEHLMELIAQLDHRDESFAERLYEALQERYGATIGSTPNSSA